MSALPQIALETYSLRDYQQTLVQQVFAQWHEFNRRVMLQLATGGGKTILFSAIASEFSAKGEKVLVLAHRGELLTQAQSKLEAVTGMPVGIIKAGVLLTRRSQFKSPASKPWFVASNYRMQHLTFPVKS